MVIPNISDKEEDIIAGSVLTSDQQFWLERGKDLIKGSSDSLDSAAKTLVTLITTLMTLYAAVLTFLGNSTHFGSCPYFFLVAIPLFAFLVAVYYFTEVISPKVSYIQPDEPDHIRAAVERRNAEKSKYFNNGRYAFVIALFLMIVCIAIVSTGNNLEKTAQFVIKEENRPFFENLSILVLDNSTKTVPLTIIEESDTGYRVKTVNGTQVFVDKKTVFGVAYPPS